MPARKLRSKLRSKLKGKTSKKTGSRKHSSSRCGQGYILRKGYTRSSGSHVSAACTPDKGKPGKTPPSRQTLPAFKGDISLREFDYSTHASTQQRHVALKEAALEHGELTVLRHLNLARNYQADPQAKQVMGQDVNFLSKMYKSQRRQSKRGSRKSSRKSSRKGSTVQSRRSSRKRSRRQSRRGSRKQHRRGSRRQPIRQ